MDAVVEMVPIRFALVRRDIGRRPARLPVEIVMRSREMHVGLVVASRVGDEEEEEGKPGVFTACLCPHQ